MKKLLYLLAALPLLFFASCHDDDDLPEVNVGIDYSGATSVDGVLYAVQGDTISIDSVYVSPVNPNSRAMISGVTYYLDQRLLGFAPISPFSVGILTDNMPTGKHALRLDMTVLETGREVGAYYVLMPIKIVSDSTQIPSGNPGTPGTYHDTARAND